MMLTLESLNASQASAVKWDGGALLVLAGPGSGKTAVLTLRVARILREQQDASVLALTFTNKAAAEMRDRVEVQLGGRADRAHLCTFHSFAMDVLRQHGSHVGLRPDFALLADDERLDLLNEAIVRAHCEGDLQGDRSGLLQLMDRLLADSYDGGPIAPVLSRAPSWLPGVFQQYCALQAEGNRLDFGGLLHFARRLLAENPGVVRAVNAAWSHVCVDEFQDTNRSQYDFLRLVVGTDARNLLIVADDDQIIYQWNGASPERLEALRRDYAMEVIQLPENYRCPAEIIDMANRLIKHNRMRARDKRELVAHRPGSGPAGVRLLVFRSPEEEAAGILKEVRDRHLPTGQTVVLGRTLRLLEGVASAMLEAGMPCQVVQRKTDFESHPLRWMYALLQLGNRRSDRDALTRVARSWDAMSAGETDVGDVAAAAALVGGDYLRGWYEGARISPAAPLADILPRLVEPIMERLEFQEPLRVFLDSAGRRWPDDRQVQDEIAAWRAMHEEIILEHSASDCTLNVYMQESALRTKSVPPPPDAVRLMTIHGAKGLEFGHVFLVGMADGVCPSYQAAKAGPTSREMEEERRNCFVAITRVKETLTLTRAESYFGYGKPPSRFLAEMGVIES